MLANTLVSSLLLLISSTSARVTFDQSEVLQDTDLDDKFTARFNCANGCRVYSDSKDEHMFISDGTRDVSNFLVMGGPEDGTMIIKPTQLVPWNDYRLEYRGPGTPPRFIFYAVDNKAPYLDTKVLGVNVIVGLFVESGGEIDRFTMLISQEFYPAIWFDGQFEAGSPRVFATGFDAVADDRCRAVYTARSSESAANSFIIISSPIITVEKVRGVKTSISHRANMPSNRENAETSMTALPCSYIYMSPGYVGCSYNNGQLYSVSANTVLDTLTSSAKTTDLDASYTLPTVADAVHLTVNNEKIDFTGTSTTQRSFDADNFYMTISWIRNSAGANFAAQLDFGLSHGNDGSKSTTKGVPVEPTTSSAGIFSYLLMIIVVAAFTD